MHVIFSLEKMALLLILLIVQARASMKTAVLFGNPRSVSSFEEIREKSTLSEEPRNGNDRLSAKIIHTLVHLPLKELTRTEDLTNEEGSILADANARKILTAHRKQLSISSSTYSNETETYECKKCHSENISLPSKDVIVSEDQKITSVTPHETITHWRTSAKFLPASLFKGTGKNSEAEQTGGPYNTTPDSIIFKSREKTFETSRAKTYTEQSIVKNTSTGNESSHSKGSKINSNEISFAYNETFSDASWADHGSESNKVVDGVLFDFDGSKKEEYTQETFKLQKKPSDNEVFDKSSPLSNFTTPDGHMNDPPFIRGPNISPEMDISNQDIDLSKKSKDYQSIEEPQKFYPLKPNMDWKIAKLQWGYAWECHCYITGSLFTAVAVYSFVNLIRIHAFMKLFNNGYTIAVNAFIIVMCLSRSFYLFYDPYNSNGKQSAVFSHLTFDILYPCMISAYAILFLFLLHVTNTQLFPIKVQRTYLIAPFIAFYFSLNITCDIIVGVFIAPTKLLLVCQIAFLGLTVAFILCFFYAFKRVYHAALRKQGEMMRITFTKMHITGSHLPKKLPKPTLSLAVKVTFVTSLLQSVFSALLLYGTFFAHYTSSTVSRLDPWPWWTYQLFCRILELALCVTMTFTTVQPLNHFETSSNKFCDNLEWFPCRNFPGCCKPNEVIDFEDHSDNYANLQGFRNYEFRASPKRYHTNSLPTFRTPLYEVDNTLPMRNIPFGRRNTNHPSVMSLLSYYRSKRSISLSANEKLNEFDRKIIDSALICTLSTQRNSTSRPPSMLYKDNGFIRFRRDNDPEQPMEMTDDDDDNSAGDADSTKVDVGSSFCSLLEDDIAQSTSSLFFPTSYNRRCRKLSHLSIETTDNSIDLSSDQLSSVLTYRNGVGSSAMDFSVRKYGSTCSSESAANSFDVTFFLNGNISPAAPSTSAATTPASIAEGSPSRSETEDDRTSSVEGHEHFLRSISPIVKSASSKWKHNLPLKLNLSKTSEYGEHGGHVNTACGTEDITPDSAVYLDMQLSKETASTSKEGLNGNKFSTGALSSLTSPLASFNDSSSPSNETSSSGSLPAVDAAKPASPTATSQSLDDLRTSNSYVIVSGARKSSGGFLNKLRGSAFSLNGTTNGYELLELKEGSQYHQKNHCQKNGKRLRRALSDRRPDYGIRSQKPLTTELMKSMPLSSMGHFRDSGLLDDSQDQNMADAASQTE